MRYLNRWTPEQLGGNWNYVYHGYQVRKVGGRTLYDDVLIGPHGGILLRKLETTEGMKVKEVHRYISPNTMLELVRL